MVAKKKIKNPHSGRSGDTAIPVLAETADIARTKHADLNLEGIPSFFTTPLQ